ncbi:GNAT family N-acetyltransferase [Methylococcus sp. EFPC2]|uniref:GNAT family N-acetyltransferase n=1 Tax=Methylococcus sp. EFPC2 TaxID=2812648 RepID=UPI001967798F|nr:GNAT family N-acetyltransferase [Methylococcus sp. EFPC2]QSA95787.1 GNAT family N-acetyltransferase [Methylococcus sp. EFPC2]
MNIVDLRYEQDYIPTLAEWHHREWAHLNPGGSVEKRVEKMQAYLSDELMPSMYVCKEGDTLLGSAGLLRNDMDTKMELTPWLASVYVAEEHRNRGIGTALVQHVVNVARAAGYPNLYLLTPNKESFYQARGWFTISKEPYREEPVTVMQLQLQDR